MLMSGKHDKIAAFYSEARYRSFATLHARGAIACLAVSVILAGVSAYGCHIFLATKGEHMSLLPSLAYGLVKWLWWGIAAFGMWLIARRLPLFIKFSPRVLAIQLLIGSVLSAIHLTLLQTIWWSGLHWQAWRIAYPRVDYFTLSSFGEDLVIYGFLFGFSGFLHTHSHRQIDALVKLELEKQLTEAQLQTLQTQMEPHFLFNTLNAITSLVAQGKNPEAMKTLSHLNTILRMTLQRRSPEKVPFGEELRVIESYLAIQQIRFADRLEVRIDASEEALKGLVPCFLLQPIIENAITHGIAPMDAGGLVETEVKRVGNRLWMRVTDNGCGVESPETQGHGIGLKNIQERLAFFYPETHDFEAIAPDAGGYQVTIQIPYERSGL
jgi:hypothetical protein